MPFLLGESNMTLMAMPIFIFFSFLFICFNRKSLDKGKFPFMIFLNIDCHLAK